MNVRRWVLHGMALGLLAICVSGLRAQAPDKFRYPAYSTDVQPVAAEEKADPVLDRIKKLEEELKALKNAAKKRKEVEEKKKKDADKKKKKDGDRLKKLEDEWKKVKEAEKKKKAEAKKETVGKMRLQGRVHLDSLWHANSSAGTGFFENNDPTSARFGNDPENRLVFRRLRFTMRGDIRTNMFYKLDLEFADPNDAQFRDALLGWKDLPFLGKLIVGNQKRPLSLDQLNSSNVNVFMERPLIADAFQEEARRIGIQSFNVSENQLATWQYGFFNNKNVQNDGSYTGDPFQGLGAARFTWLPFFDECSGGRNYLHLGMAGSIARYNGTRDARDPEQNVARFRARPELRTVNRWVNTGRIMNADWGYQELAEVILNLGPLAIVGEYELDQITRIGGSQDVFFHGGYVYVAYFLTGDHQKYNHKEGKLARPEILENFFLVERLCGGHGGGWGAWQVAARYSYIDLSDADIRGGVQNNLTFALNWWWNDHSRLMFNYVIGQIEQRGPIGGFEKGSFNTFTMRFHMDW